MNEKSKAQEVLDLIDLGEMANVPQRVYRLPLAHDVKFNLLQGQKLSHDARVKVFRKDPKTGPNFSVRLSSDPNAIEVIAGEVFVTAKERELIIDHVKKYRTAYLKLWSDAGMTIDELRDLMDEIDKRSQP